MERRRPVDQATFLRRHRREAGRALVVLMCLMLAQRAQALPIFDRFIQNVFEPDRLNRWFTLWEKVIHLAKFQLHTIPRILMMPFSGIHGAHGRAMELRRGLSDLHLRGLLGRVQLLSGYAGQEGGTPRRRNDQDRQVPASSKKAAAAHTPQQVVVVRAKQ
ncbi:uncharacterized protein LOC144124933 [Amblyomma americanum]